MKTVWLTQLLLGVPLGVITGYVLTAILVTYADVRKMLFYDFLLSIVEMGILYTINLVNTNGVMFHVYSCKVFYLWIAWVTN